MNPINAIFNNILGLLSEELNIELPTVEKAWKRACERFNNKEEHKVEQKEEKPKSGNGMKCNSCNCNVKKPRYLGEDIYCSKCAKKNGASERTTNDKKDEIKKEPTNEVEGCNEILGKGSKRVGQYCGAKCKDGNTKCTRHMNSKNNKEEDNKKEKEQEQDKKKEDKKDKKEEFDFETADPVDFNDPSKATWWRTKGTTIIDEATGKETDYRIHRKTGLIFSIDSNDNKVLVGVEYKGDLYKYEDCDIKIKHWCQKSNIPIQQNEVEVEEEEYNEKELFGDE